MKLTNSSYTTLAVLPNISITDSIETNFSALVPAHDSRVLHLCDEHPIFKRFLSRFTDVFGRKIAPSVFLFKPTDQHQRPSFEAMASFRDMVYICTVPCNQACLIEYGTTQNPLWSDYFNFYPWMTDRNFEYLIGNSPSFTGLDKIDGFRGQSSPNLFAVSSKVTDRPLLNALISKWEDHYFTNSQDKVGTRIFRSLNMAFRAGEMPSGMGVNAYDAGRLIALWVSAFEILAHPEKGNVTPRIVRELISRSEWQHRSMPELVFEKTLSNGSKVSLDISAKLLDEFYRIRNDFMHGNIVDEKVFCIGNSEKIIFNFPALLYRVAIATKIDLSSKKPEETGENLDDIGSHITDLIYFNHPQRQIERALLSIGRPSPRRE